LQKPHPLARIWILVNPWHLFRFVKASVSDELPCYILKEMITRALFKIYKTWCECIYNSYKIALPEKE